MNYQCLTCGEFHHGLPDMGADRPDYYWGVPEEERSRRIDLTSDTCIIDNEYFFIRGVLEIPVIDYPESFGFGVWVSQKRENYYTYLDNYDSREIGPFFGWLSSSISYYGEETCSLKTMVHFQGNGQRPRIELETTGHPLAIDQHRGISLAKAWEIVHYYFDLDQGA